MFRSVVTTDATSGYEHDVYIGAVGFVITGSNAYPEATLNWIDHFFSDEGTKQYFMDVEAVSGRSIQSFIMIVGNSGVTSLKSYIPEYIRQAGFAPCSYRR